MEKDKPAAQGVKLVFVDISHVSRPWQFGLLSAGVFVFFLLNGVVEEFTFRQLPGNFEFGWYLTFFELLCFAGFAAMQRSSAGEGAGRGGVLQHSAELRRHLLVAVAMTASRGLTNVSLEYLNYPTQVIFKSTKLLAVMVASVAFLAKSYGRFRWAAAALLVVSAGCFSLGDHTVEPEWSETGLVVVVLSLVADAWHSVSQDQVMHAHGAGVLETMLYTNFYGALCTLVVLVLKGELWPAVAYCSEYPVAYALFVSRALVIYCGVLCFVQLVKLFDIVIATAVTTVRKILTILLSFVLYPKPFTGMYAAGLVVFVLGVAVETYQKKLNDAAKANPRSAAARADVRSNDVELALKDRTGGRP